MTWRTLLPALAAERGTANGRRRWARLRAPMALFGFLVTPFSACGSRTSESIGGETHWLSACSAQRSCGDGLECLCGRCSIACSSDTECREFAPRAACLPTEVVTDAKGCPTAPRRICAEQGEPDENVTPSIASDASAPGGSDVTGADSTTGSNEGAPSASTSGEAADASAAVPETPSTIDELPTPEGWDGLKLIDPYSDECVITETLDRNTQPYGEEGLGYVQFSCGGGASLTAVCMLGERGLGRPPLWECSCSGGGGRTASSLISFEDVGWTETQACRMAGALCVTELPAEMARAQESCAPGASTNYPDSCLHQAECVRLVKVGELVIEQTLESRASCFWSSEDVAECSCTGVAYSGASFSVSPFVSDDNCSAARSLCNDGIDTGSLGAIECTLDVEHSSRSEAWCDEVYQCAQPAAIAGRALQFGAQLASHCYRLEPDDPWECSCWSEHTTFVDAPDLTAACQANLGRCLEIKGGDIVNW